MAASEGGQSQILTRTGKDFYGVMGISYVLLGVVATKIQ